MIHLVIPSADAMREWGIELAAQLRAGDLLVLDGPLGAGKTTFTRGLGEGLGIRGTVTSPTFVLARTHPSVVGGPALVHVDAYRLGDARELDDLDIDYVNSVVVVEWGAGMVDGVSDSWLEMQIERPTGAGQAPDAADTSSNEQSTREPQTEADEHSELDVDEPRVVTVKGYGARWAGTAFAA